MNPAIVTVLKMSSPKWGDQVREVKVYQESSPLLYDEIGMARKQIQAGENFHVPTHVLEKLFELGQNEMQSMDISSISVADIINFGANQKYRVDAEGFTRMTEKEFLEYAKKQVVDRIIEANKGA